MQDTHQDTREIFYRWRFSPVATSDDARWQGRRKWDELVVAAQSPGHAIELAERFYRRNTATVSNPPLAPTGAHEPGAHGTSGFEDPSLYELDRRDFVADPLPYASTMYSRPGGYHV